MESNWLVTDISAGTNKVGMVCQQLVEMSYESPEETAVDRHGVFPIRNDVAYSFYKKQTANIWTVEEMDFSKDKDDYLKLDKESRDLLDSLLTFLGVIDGVVIESIFLRMYLSSKTPEERMYYSAQLFMESVHAETYSKMIRSIVPPDRVKEVKEKFNELESLTLKDEWIEAYVKDDLPFPYMALVFSCVEGIFLMSPIFMIFSFRKDNKFPGVVFANEQISKDERLHSEYGEAAYVANGGIEEEHAIRIVKEAVELECATIDEILPRTVGGIDPEEMKNFIRYIADIKLGNCGHKQVYNIDPSMIPQWIRGISMEQKSNFHELPSGNYAKHSNDVSEHTIDDYADIDF